MKLTAIAALVASSQAVYLHDQLAHAGTHHEKKPVEHKNMCEGYDKSGDL